MVLKIQELVYSAKIHDRSQYEFYHASSDNKRHLIDVETGMG